MKIPGKNNNSRAGRKASLRPYHARVTVDIEMLAKGQEPRLIVQMPFTFEAADAAIGAAMSSIAVATEGNVQATAEARSYLERLPQVFDEMQRRKIAAVVFGEPDGKG